MDGSFLDTARDIVLGHAAATLSRAADAGAFDDASPRTLLLAACMRLEAMGLEEGAVARRIYSRSDLADEIALPDVNAGARIIRILNSVEPIQAEAQEQARIGIRAVCDLLAPLTA